MDRTQIKPFEEIEYKVYGYTLPEVPNHDGYVKIGDTTRDAVTRVFEQVGTAGLNPNILFEKLAKRSDGAWFRDKDLHKFLLLNGIEKKNFNQRADEWFYFNNEPEKAEELTDKYINRDYDEVQIDDKRSDYILRKEQEEAVANTYDYYRSEAEAREFLWNAKPRFGKTLTTYDFIRKIKAKNVLIVTNRPAIANSWFDDFNKFIAWQEPHMKFVSETDALSGKAMTRAQYLDFLDSTSHQNPMQIFFTSLQDLKGAKFAGGHYEKLEWLPGLNWDLLVIDEAHEGIDTKRTDIAFKQLKKDFTLHLSGTPFKALAKGDFSEEQIFNWSYADEQKAKENWDITIGGNPYESLPTLNLFTYQMSKMVQDEVSAGLTLEEETNVDYAFDLNEFFRVKENGQFEYEASVRRFLDNLSQGKFPFSESEYRKELNHTFWLLPRVNAAKALEKLLKTHPTFKEYKIVLAAGDGISLHQEIESEALDLKANTKSFDRVRTAIEENEKTITLSVGQLTTGVTIPEWTAVLMLNNIESPSLYFQAAFRSQNPYEYEKDGKLFRKENAYIFDFSPDRTLKLYDDFANNLTSGSSKTTSEREAKIKKLLNFFPVIAEDEEGMMHEIDASEVLAIPTQITSREVVKRGFMSNLLFTNISGIFSGDSPFKEILDKIPPEKNKRLQKPREVQVTDPHLNEDGEVEAPKELVLGRTKDIFGEKIYSSSDVLDQVVATLDKPEQAQEQTIKRIANDITASFSDGFDNLRHSFKLNKGQANRLKKDVNTSIEDIISEQSLTLSNQVKDLDKKYEDQKEAAKLKEDKQELDLLSQQYEEEKEAIESSFTERITKEVEATIHTVVEEEIEKVEESKKKRTEDDVRDHLRGFSRTIPAFLMAYGDEGTSLANFEKNIDEASFEDLTSITIDEFKKLRDGFTFLDDNGDEKTIPGLFNEVVFNASIKEFLDTKKRLANYFDDALEEDIFDYIPPQKTNQIFTPKNVVKLMVDSLEEEDPSIFKDKKKTFVDLYAKSGLYITEIVKRLNEGLKTEIPDQKERIKWILENQVYACAPSNIIYNIVKSYIYGNVVDVSTANLVERDTIPRFMDGNSKCLIRDVFGDDELKFDVIIGNPPYQKEDNDSGKGSAGPLYNHFINESIKLEPEYISLITPSVWFTGGKGLNDFRRDMLNDVHFKMFHTFSTPKYVFPNVNLRGGVNFFLWDSKHDNSKNGIRVINNEHGEAVSDKVRPYKITDIEIFISDNRAIDLVEKLLKAGVIVKDSEDERMLTHYISSRNPFGFETKFRNSPDFKKSKENISHPVKMYASRSSVGYIEESLVDKNKEWINRWKVITPFANNIGTDLNDDNLNTILAEPGSIATETYLVIGGDMNLDKVSAENLSKYIKTKFVRTLLSLVKANQNGTRQTYRFIPIQNFGLDSDIDWEQSLDEIDQQLFLKYDLSDEHKDFIENRVKDL